MCTCVSLYTSVRHVYVTMRGMCECVSEDRSVYACVNVCHCVYK